jgi:hypothetical protein
MHVKHIRELSSSRLTLADISDENPEPISIIRAGC